MRAMLARVGVDPLIAVPARCDTVFECVIEACMKESRRRCRECQAIELCERWLAGDQSGDNDFCPNSTVFSELKIIGGSDAGH